MSTTRTSTATAALLWGLMLTGCSDTWGPVPSQTCVPRATQPCTCFDGQPGTQVCNSSSFWGVCGGCATIDAGGPPRAFCGDGVCGPGESSNCPTDCGSPPPTFCGRGGTPVPCGPGQCAQNAQCVDPTQVLCQCRAGFAAVDCGGVPCTSGSCQGGAWHCAMSAMPARCPGWAANVPATAPVHSCNEAPGPTTLEIVRQLNALWSSNLRACPCGPNELNGPARCQGNAFVMGNSPGVIHYDRQFLGMLSARFGDGIAAGMVLGHEAGHSIQFATGMVSNLSIVMELSADCYAGYFLGALECTGQVSMSSFSAAFMAACSLGDNLAWFEQGAHGSCQDRVQWVQRGIEGYRRGLGPDVVCRP